MARPSPWRRPAQRFPLFPHLAVVPALLAIATAVSLFAHSDVNAALLWSQCHARALLPALSRVPVLGTPSCFLVGFLYAALDSLRSRAVMGVILAFVGALLTVSTVESARKVNARSPVVSRPTLPWLVFNLGGGALVWQLVIVPAFIQAAQAWPPARREGGDDDDDDEAVPDGHGRESEADAGRHVSRADVVAIPVAVALGYYVPSALMLGLPSPVAIGSWLFSPAYVSLIRRFVRHSLRQWPRFRPARAIHLEAHARALAAVYALPVLGSLLAHGFLIGNLAAGADDRREMTVSAMALIVIEFQYIGLTLLYWVFVEVGWRAPLAIALLSVLLGPGAGTAVGWVYREKLIASHLVAQPLASAGDVDDQERGPGQADEQTPLLQ
ncbi:uncharacterized protein UV8b_06758 [Ustilaginoidea virens]|uniref:Corticosteroid-binding protein n=1 Tax=Ustilaginoidea virens TaxID=1159556 RepID=A0A063BKU3_USTVR|nr:uncharacterized protein UV8b_06758 [Ustilaginoidea virens]QUC22517.1 hypothetical protein UV8b_06758 [Ustilaginoidea virens]GAO19722.1 hypothetical protein UVI_02062630 [Ustilaginoidea virens]